MVETGHQPRAEIVQIQHSEQVKNIEHVSINDFITSEIENDSLQELHHELFTYMLQKLAIADSCPEQPFINLQDYFSVTRTTHTSTSQVAYLEIMNAVFDSKNTMLELLHELFDKFISGQSREYLVIEGDQKLFEILQSIKFEYGKEMDWAIPFPGDWHTLKNYQPAVIKPYFDAGLKDLASVAGYPAAATQACGAV